MKKLLEVIPFALLLGLVPFFYYNSPNISQAIIILGVCGLCGFRLYAMDKVKPDYVKIFQEQFDSYRKDHNTEMVNIINKHEKAMIHLEKTVKDLNSNYGKMTMDQTRKTSINKFEF